MATRSAPIEAQPQRDSHRTVPPDLPRPQNWLGYAYFTRSASAG